MLAIVDYGAGNIFSVKNALDFLGIESVLTSDKSEIEAADAVILPGVGAFPWAMSELNKSGLIDTIKHEAQRKPFLGICLGMQLLFEKSYEYGEHEGLGLIKGSIVPLAGYIPENLKIPHIGWNAISFKKEHKLFKYIKEGDFVYFVHSYYAADCEDSVIADTEYGARVTAAAASGNIMGCQFHPEKSGNVGLNILRAFCETEN